VKVSQATTVLDETPTSIFLKTKQLRSEEDQAELLGEIRGCMATPMTTKQVALDGGFR